MPNPPTTPNMGLIQPVVGPNGTPSPTWATDLNINSQTLDSHNHTPGQGVPITPAGLNISSDLSFLSNNATNLRSTRYIPISLGTLTGADVGCIVVSGVDLYYVDENGNQIQITANGGVAGSQGSISGLSSPASASYVSANRTFVWQSGVGLPANMDMATPILRYNGTVGYPSPSGSNWISLEVPSTISSGYALTLPVAPPANNAFLQFNTTGALVAGPNISGGITNSNLAPVNYAISSSCGNFSVATNTPTNVTNLSATITTVGRPVRIALVADGSGSPAFVGVSGSSTTLQMVIAILEDGGTISNQVMEVQTSATGNILDWPASSICHEEYSPTVGSHTYTVQVYSTGANPVHVAFCKLVAREL